MENLHVLLEEKASSAIAKAFTDLSKEDTKAEIAPCLQEQFGHYQCNNALKLAKKLKKNPREVAQQIVTNFDLDHDGKKMIEKLEIAGPGFINITLTSEFLSIQLDQALRDKHLGVRIPSKKEKIIVEFSSPNIAKELHVGHLRSTIIGDCIANLFEFFEQEVLRLNHIGDWGTQFGMLIAFMKEKAPHVLEGKEKVDPTTLTEWYKSAKRLFDEDAAFQKRAYDEVVKLQAEDPECINAWKIICDLSRVAYEEIYDLLNIHTTDRGESFYNPYLQKIVDELDKKKMITVSDGAKCIYLEGFKNREGKPLPIIIQKSDGGFNYDTTDMAGFWHRTQVEKADRIIVVTDAGQSLHFKMIYAAAVKAGYIDPKKTHFDHVTFGLVLGADGKKFKTREGKTEKLLDLLLEAISYAKRILKERNPDLSEKEIDSLAKTLGIGAVKYADLSSLRTKDYTFSYEKMLKLEGNTAAFLEYAFVRILGIKRKTKANMDQVIKYAHISLEHPSEVSLGLHLRRFGEVLQIVSRDLLPNRLTDYLYELAEKFNAFFRDCRVEGSDKEKERLALCEITAKILEKGLNILGLQTMSRM